MHDVTINWPDEVVTSRMPFNTVLDFHPVSESGAEYVTKDEVKRQIQMDLTFTDQDTYLDELIIRCRKIFERVLGLSLRAKVLYAVLQNQLGNMELPGGWVNSVTNAQDISGNTINPANYVMRGVAGGFRYLDTKYDYIALTYSTLPYADDGLKGYLLEEIAYHFIHRGDEGYKPGEMYTRAAAIYSRRGLLP